MFIFFCKFVVALAFQQFYFDISLIWKLLV